ncbi:zinc finger protein 777-like [Acanthochromis polyacanthus]|uniref:zinc finger protein 777-like n=1 Tax=Acanthochromis polyacanthus TaxID=80966 RepID=UPI002234794A|nr:zinc finger protein 777-like [Acanthochromis polyacanthus]
MSADDFQTLYASFMDGMLKSAVAETTKLFETMVDELKAEISRMKKENEDLKTRCSLYESAKSQTADHGENNTVSGQNDGSEKRDSAVQCDLVPVRAVLVEHCQSLQNQMQQYTFEGILEHNYIAHEIKQEELETVLKQEEVEPTVVCGQAGLLQASVSGAENEEPLARQESSTQNVETRLLEPPCLQMGSSVQGTQNQSSYTEPTIAISLAAIKEDLQEESEFDQTVLEKRMQGELTISGKHQSVPQHCQGDTDTSVNEQSDMHHTENQSEPNLLVRHRRGPPPKKMKQHRLQSSSVDVSREQKGLNLCLVREEGVFLQTSPDQPQKTSSAITPSVQDRLYPAFEDMENGRVDSLPISVSVAIHSPLTEVSSANESLDTRPADSSQAPSSHLNDCHTSVTLQDAMLLVEAMNQSTVENAVTQEMAPPETHSAPCEGTLQMVDKIPTEPTSVETPHITDAIATSEVHAHIAVVIPKQKRAPSPFNTTTLSLSPSATAPKTTAQSLTHPLMSLTAPSKPNKAVPHAIIVMPKSRSSFTSQKVAAVSPTQLSTGASSAQDCSSKVVGLPPDTSSHSSVPQTVNATSRNFFPVFPSQLPTNSAEQHLGTLSHSKALTIPTQLSAVASRKHQSQTTVLTVKQNSAEPTAPVTESSTQLIFSSPESSISALHNPILSQKNDDTTDSLETSKQTASVSGTKACSSLIMSDGQVPTSVFPVLPPAVEQKLMAVVRLTRLPFPVSTKESFLVSRLLTQEKPLRQTVSLSEVPALSSSSCSSLTETSVAVSANASQMTDKSDNHVLFSETPNLAMEICSNEVQDKQSDAHLQVPIKDTPDPPSPAETPLLAESPIQVTTKATSDNFTDARVLFSETRTCDQKSLQKKLLVARLRSHLKSHSKARRPEATPKFCSASPIRSTREGATPIETESTAVSLRSCSYSKNDASSKMSGNSTFTINSPGIKQIKKEFSSPFRLTRYSMQTDSTKKSNSETVSQSVEGPIMAETPRRSVKILNSVKLAKAPKAKTIAKMRNSHKSKLQKHQLAENQGKCEIVKICRAKVWIPPVMPADKMPPAGERKSLLSSVNTETKPNKQSFVCPSLVIRASPVVSPLEPLAVIGRHLLRNQCGECGRILSSSAALESHVGLHTGRRPFSCTLCGKSFPDVKSYKRHGRVHRNGRIHICQQCGKGFVYRFGLTKHVQMVHSKIKRFICQICNKGFFTKRDVEVHIRIHTGEKPFHCNYCDKKFTRRVELNVHLRWHNGEKRHWCPYCGKGFLDFNNLKRHKYIHTGEKPHSCPHCPKQFTQSGHLKKHVKNVHKAQ